ncbi:MAG: hypothetical protein IT452_18445 [Planctomycetia bacterium]|nr:hypothetical protein [Planctomycetia bacterium]
MRRLLVLLLAALAAFPPAAAAGPVPTPRSDPDELEQALREAWPGQGGRIDRLLGHDPDRAGLNSLYLQLIIYGAIVAVILIVGTIAIIGHNLSKKDNERERLFPP